MGGSWVRRWPIAYVTGVPNLYWLTVGQGLLSLQQVRAEGECCYFFCFFTFIPVPLSSLFLSFIFSSISSISIFPFSGRWHKMTHKGWYVIKPQHSQSRVNPCPAEPGYTLHLQTVQIQISWLLKPTDLDLHCLPLSMWIYSNNLDQVIWLAKNYKWMWHLNLFSRTRVNIGLDKVL